MKSNRLCFLSSFFLVLLGATTPLASRAQEPAGSQKPPIFTKDMTVYVSDFDLDVDKVQVDKGSVVNQIRPGILERPSKKEQTDPATQAKKLVDTMSNSIVSDLQKAGYKAQRLTAGDPKPSAGAWVHGVFTQADEGNRLHRAVIGFGSGSVKMQLFVTLTALSAPQKPLYETSAEGGSRDKVGAAITMNPYVAAAKFVVEKNAPEKAVKSAASDITKEIIAHLQQHEIAGSSQ